MQSSKEEWIVYQLNNYAGIKKEVIEFIANIRYKSEDSMIHIVDLFSVGYCYYFAIMLQVAFGRGTICYSYDNGHIVWVDDDNNKFDMRTAYDINGVYTLYNKNCLIPIDIFQEGIIDFMRVPNLEFNAKKEYIKERADVWLSSSKFRSRYNSYNQIRQIAKYVERWKRAVDMPYYSINSVPIELADRYMHDFTEAFMQEYPNANQYILEFIEDMIFKSGINGVPYIVTLFCRGYCYYFAKILKEAFPNGTIWISLNMGHIVFVDGDNPFDSLCYDARGIVTDVDINELCPIEIFGNLIIDYMHLPYHEYEGHGIELQDIADRWRDNGSKSISELLKEAEGN